jgi:hypothetical protein
MNITLTREEAQQVLDALEKISMGGHPDWADDVIPLLRARLSAPEPPCKTGSQCIGGKCPQCVVSEPEPVAWLYFCEGDDGRPVLSHAKQNWANEHEHWTEVPLYTAPPQRNEPEPVAGYRWEEGRTPPSVTFTAPPQPEPEPVAWMNESDIGRTDWKVWAHGKPTATMPLYTALPQRKEWQGLTDEECDEIWDECLGVFDCLKMTEAKLKEKNT